MAGLNKYKKKKKYQTGICVFILVYMCRRTTIYVSSYYYILVLILQFTCPHTTIYVSSYYYIRVLIRVNILLYACPEPPGFS
jgi:hypothetical protein